MAKQIIMTVPCEGISTGKTVPGIETSGFKGGECKTATAALKAALGEVRDETLKPEYYERPTTQQQTIGQT